MYTYFSYSYHFLIIIASLFMPFIVANYYQQIFYSVIMFMHIFKNNFINYFFINTYTSESFNNYPKRTNKLPMIYYIAMTIVNLYYDSKIFIIINDILYILYINSLIIYMIKLHTNLANITFKCDTEYNKQVSYIHSFKKRSNKLVCFLLIAITITNAFLILFNYISQTEILIRTAIKIIIICYHYTNYIFLSNNKQPSGKLYL